MKITKNIIREVMNSLHTDDDQALLAGTTAAS